MNCTSLVCTRSLIFLIFLFGIGFGYIPFSQAQGNCSAEMNNQAEFLLIDARGNWTSLLRHQRIFALCDDGVLGEGYSDTVAYLFSRRWDQFGVFVTLSKKYPAFQRWAVRHIDATASDEDLNKIIINATTCINDAAVKNLCKAIRQAAANALTESIQIRRWQGGDVSE